LQVVHTGISSKDIQIIGDIKGAMMLSKKEVRVIKHLPLPTSKRFDERIKPITKRRITAVLIVLFGIFFSSIYVFLAFSLPVKGNWIFAIIGAIIFIYFCFSALRILRIYVPTGLESFGDDITK
jgi:hypothetical protein